jgi:hypothetical protein
MWLSGRTLRTSGCLGRKIRTVEPCQAHLAIPLHVTANCVRCALQVQGAWLPVYKCNVRREIDQSYRKSVAYIVSVLWYVLMSQEFNINTFLRKSVRISTFLRSREFNIFICSYVYSNWICIENFPYSRKIGMYQYVLMLEFNMYRYVLMQKISIINKFLCLEKLSMYQYVLIFTGIQYIVISFHIHWNSICIDTFSYSRECNIIHLTFISIENVSIFLYSLEFSMCRYILIFTRI